MPQAAETGEERHAQKRARQQVASALKSFGSRRNPCLEIGKHEFSNYENWVASFWTGIIRITSSEVGPAMQLGPVFFCIGCLALYFSKMNYFLEFRALEVKFMDLLAFSKV